MTSSMGMPVKVRRRSRLYLEITQILCLLALVAKNVAQPDEYFVAECEVQQPVADALASATATLSLCIANHSAPVLYCSHCIEEYNSYTEIFDLNLSTDCQSFGAYKTMADDFDNIWDSSYCNSCSQSSMLGLQQKYKLLLQCVAQNKGEANNTCDMCRDEYTAVSTTYSDSLTDACRKNVDIIDTYRRALTTWSAFHCLSGSPDTTSVIIIISLIFVWMFCLYASARFLSASPSEFFFGTVEPNSPPPGRSSAYGGIEYDDNGDIPARRVTLGKDPSQFPHIATVTPSPLGLRVMRMDPVDRARPSFKTIKTQRSSRTDVPPMTPWRNFERHSFSSCGSSTATIASCCLFRIIQCIFSQ
eukprot:m.527917 g.527917  ORF g.527917 m.527917 type:complete len:360 (+) comp22013_c1_seq3:184-1263(+)